MCGYLLESGLAGAGCPHRWWSASASSSAARCLKPAELTQAIEDQRAMLAELTAAQSITGPGRISGMYSSEDRLQAAVDDLFGAPARRARRASSAARLSGIRELYLMT